MAFLLQTHRIRIVLLSASNAVPARKVYKATQSTLNFLVSSENAPIIGNVQAPKDPLV